MTKEDVFNEFPKYSDDEGNARKKQAYSLMFDIITNFDAQARFVGSCLNDVHRTDLRNSFGYCDEDYLTDEAYDVVEQIIENNIMDDSEFWLVYDKKRDKWMFSLTYDWIDYPDGVISDCKEIGSNYKDCMYDYLDIWKGLDVFIKFCEAILTNDYSWMKENALGKMDSMKERFKR